MAINIAILYIFNMNNFKEDDRMNSRDTDYINLTSFLLTAIFSNDGRKALSVSFKHG